jgi:hypothetical protein
MLIAALLQAGKFIGNGLTGSLPILIETVQKDEPKQFINV